MGSAGLNIKRLAGLLEQIKIECAVLDGDKAEDHCVLCLSSIKRPGVIALIEYENQGVEPRLAGMTILPAEAEHGLPFEWQETLHLSGSRKGDPEKLIEWIKEEFLRIAAK